MKRSHVFTTIAVVLGLCLSAPVMATNVETESLQDEESEQEEETQSLQEAESEEEEETESLQEAETEQEEETESLQEAESEQEEETESPQEAESEQKEDTRNSDEEAPDGTMSLASAALFGELLTDLVKAGESGEPVEPLIQAELDEIRAVSEEDYTLAKSITDLWQQAFPAEQELSAKEYAVSLEQPEYGWISADKTSALCGERVTVSLDLDRRHNAVSVKYNGREAFRNSDGTFSFLMPDTDALVTVELEECSPDDTAADFGVAVKMPVPFGEATSAAPYFAYPCNERLASLPLALLQLVPEETYSWEYEYVADKPYWKLTLMDYANIYSFLHDHTLDQEAVREVLSDADKMVHRKAFTDEEINLLLGDDEEAVMEYFASDSTIVIGKKGYSEGWMYSHTIEDYEAEGITPEMVSEVLPCYYNPLFVQEAADAFSRKLFRFTSILTPTKWEQWIAGDANLDGTVNVKDVALLQSYLDGISRMDFEEWASVDMTADSVVDEADMELLQRKILSGKEDEPTVMLDVMEYCQYPDYPTGCESVSLYMLLKYYDVKVTVDQIYDLLPMGLQPYEDENGVWHGANPEREFVGDPRSDYSYGVFHEPIAKVAEQFKSGTKTKTGASIDDIKAVLDTGNPVLAWYVSQPMRDIMYRWTWLDENKETVSWPGGEHAVVICGYDDTSLIYRDPNAGTTVVIDYDTFEKNFQELGSRIVYYSDAEEDTEEAEETQEPAGSDAGKDEIIITTTTVTTTTNTVTGETTTTTKTERSSAAG